MPETDKIVAEMSAALTGVGETNTRIAQAAAHANDVQARMAVTGFTGIVIGMTEVVDALGQIRTRLHTVADNLRTTAGTVRDIGADTDAEHAAGRLATADQQMTATTVAVSATAEAMAEAGQRVAAVLRGGEPGPLIALITAAKETLGLAGQRIHTARERTAEALREARQAGK